MPAILFQPPPVSSSAQSEIENLQTTLASLNQRILILQEYLTQRDQEIADLKTKLKDSLKLNPQFSEEGTNLPEEDDTTLTILDVLLSLYKFILPPRKVKD